MLYLHFVKWLTNIFLEMERRLNTPGVEPRTQLLLGSPRSLDHHPNPLIAMDLPRLSRTTNSLLLTSERTTLLSTRMLTSHMLPLRIRSLSSTLRMPSAPRPRESRAQLLSSSESSRQPRTPILEPLIRTPFLPLSSHSWSQLSLNSPRMRLRLSSDNNRLPSSCSDLPLIRMPLS